MLKTLPYNALRTLESVVRLRGFARAADELNVTQSAVSQHIRALEEWLGHKLLLRKGRQTVPTQSGERLAEAVRSGFGPIGALCDELKSARYPDAPGLHLAAPPGFAYLWLLPRLIEFDAAYPDTPVSLSTDPVSLNIRTSSTDAIISYSTGGSPDMHTERLMGETLSPVCTPEIARTLAAPSDLAGQVILEDTHDDLDRPTNWQVWARGAGVALPRFRRSRRFGQANLVIQAAIDGLGVAMGRSAIVIDALASGRLVEPFPVSVASQYSYWFVCRHNAADQPALTAFRRWLVAQGARQTAS